MTDDIVARLRDWEIHSTGRNPANAPFAEAADKIERLRAKLSQERERCARVADEIAEGHEFDAPFEETEEHQHAKLMYAKHVRRVAAAIRSMK